MIERLMEKALGVVVVVAVVEVAVPVVGLDRIHLFRRWLHRSAMPFVATAEDYAASRMVFPF